MVSAWDYIVGTFRGVVDGDVDARMRAGRWAEVLLNDEAQERLHALLAWLEHVQLRSIGKWLPESQIRRCAVSAGHVECAARATGMCACCGRPVCLHHAMISRDADLLCAPCFAVARKHAVPFVAAPPAPETNDLERAFRVLGVSEDASDDEVRRAYRDKLRRNHPDVKRSDAAKARAEAKFKEIRSAWDVVSSARGIS
jgi:hypothetical protein